MALIGTVGWSCYVARETQVNAVSLKQMHGEKRANFTIAGLLTPSDIGTQEIYARIMKWR
jgi:hypothetical protein